MIKGIEKLTAAQVKFMQYLHEMQKSCYSAEYQKGMEITKVKFDTNGILCVYFKNGDWYHYLENGTWY